MDAGQLGAVVPHDRLAFCEKPIKLRATLAPEIEVSATRARHSRVQSSTTQNAHATAVDKLTKSSDQRSFGHAGISRGARVPHARFPAASSANHEALLALQPKQALVGHLDALPSQ
jgi:hypothetical protein